MLTDAASKSLAGTAFAAKKKKQKLLLNPSSASGGPGTITVPLALTKTAKKTLKKMIALASLEREYASPGTQLQIELTVEAVRHRAGVTVKATTSDARIAQM